MEILAFPLKLALNSEETLPQSHSNLMLCHRKALTQRRKRNCAPYMEKPFKTCEELGLCSLFSESCMTVRCGAGNSQRAEPRLGSVCALGSSLSELRVRQTEHASLASGACCGGVDGFLRLRLLLYSKHLARHGRRRVHQRMRSHSQQAPIKGETSSQRYALHGKKTGELAINPAIVVLTLPLKPEWSEVLFRLGFTCVVHS